MAGYIFSLKDKTSLEKCIHDGVYSTIINMPKNNIWNVAHESTFGDYMTMKEGDKVFFFHDRKIYGIGELVTVKFDCKLLNFPNADLPHDDGFIHTKQKMILNEIPENINNRMLCTFKGAPSFFKNGIDMDEALTYHPDNFKMLRAFWKLSFIKLDDIETKNLIDIILKNNEQFLNHNIGIFNEAYTTHKRVKQIANHKYRVSSTNILNEYAEDNGSVRHEMAVELGVLDTLSNNKASIFGKWDYLSHQVIASPFKPIEYMDKMDIFGYKYIPNFNTISKYLIIEIKKGIANENDISQLMKYVDWVNQEYSFGDYNMIEAFLVAYDFANNIKDFREKIAVRNYIKSRRPPTSEKWSNIRLIKYKFDKVTKKLQFIEVE